jgi:hypothetical protein
MNTLQMVVVVLVGTAAALTYTRGIKTKGKVLACAVTLLVVWLLAFQADIL